MIFSQWQPQGGYKYFESERQHPIGDDLPDVRMPLVSGGIGVPAQNVGFPIPKGAVHVGEGDHPVGVMAPMSRSGNRSLGSAAPDSVFCSCGVVVVLATMLTIIGAAVIFSRD